MAITEAVLTRASSPRERFPELLRRLKQAHPDAHCSLDFASPFQLLAATILSAQCTDERVNMVTPGLFSRYPTPQAFAAADRAELEDAVRSTGFYHRKAEYLQESGRIIAGEYDGQVPTSMEALLRLPGVSRKTANVVLGNAYGMAEGVVVDTHVQRLSGRLGLTTHTDPPHIEQDLMDLVPRSEWTDLAHLLIFHGRRVCQARKPDCARCVLNDLCPSAREPRLSAAPGAMGEQK